ncbi:MAG: restriction endonuclease [Anaerolineales bacterium]|nr:restriction endonuclease [Anaerolineales bacterium]
MAGALSLLEILLLVIVPTASFILLVMGGRLLWDRYQRARSTAPPAPVARSSVGLTLDDLERLARDYYRSQGYDVVVANEPGRPAEMVALKGERQILIRCDLSDAPLGAEAVKVLARARDQVQAQRAVLIAPAGFLSDARRRAVELGVELRDKTQIDLMRTISDRRAA